MLFSCVVNCHRAILQPGVDSSSVRHFTVVAILILTCRVSRCTIKQPHQIDTYVVDSQSVHDLTICFDRKE